MTREISARVLVRFSGWIALPFAMISVASIEALIRKCSIDEERCPARLCRTGRARVRQSRVRSVLVNETRQTNAPRSFTSITGDFEQVQLADKLAKRDCVASAHGQ